MTTPDEQHDGPWESEMSDELERRAGRLHGAPLTLDAVKGRATTIRNRRRAVVAGGVLAAAAALVPVAVLATGGADDSRGIEPAVPSVTVTDPSVPTPDQTPSPAASPSRLPDVAALGFDYLEVGSASTTYHRVDGTTADLPGTDYLGATDLGDQIAAYGIDNGGDAHVDVVVDGTVASTYDIRMPMVTAPDGRTVAFIDSEGTLKVLSAEAGEQDLVQVDRGISLSAFVGNGDCALESGCHPFLEYDDFTEKEAFELNYEGPDTAPAPGALRVNDAEDSFLVSVQTESTDMGSCGGLYDRAGGGRWVFQTCKAQVLDISPTGEYVVGTDPYGDGLGPRYFSILGTDGKEVARYETDPGFVIGTYAWIDETHAVAVVNDDGAWTIVSLGVDGTVEELAGPVDGVDLPEPFVIAH